MNYDYAVFIGRMQPPHRGHAETMVRALEEAGRLIVVQGGYRSSRTIKDPWTTGDRVEMTLSAVPSDLRDRISFVSVRDRPYDDSAWCADVHQKVRSIVDVGASVVLVGCKKDDSSYYLDLFPQWGLIDTGLAGEILSATDIREKYFSGCSDWHLPLSGGVTDFMTKFMKSTEFTRLSAEFAEIRRYKESWAVAPYAPIFVTTDCVVIKSGHILLVKRSGGHGHGLFALPGGFLEPGLWLKDNAIKELIEETSIEISREELESSIRDSRVFDFPGRSLRGRTVTHAFKFQIPGGGILPHVQGGSDASSAMWMPLGDIRINEGDFFEDHLEIIEAMVWTI